MNRYTIGFFLFNFCVLLNAQNENNFRSVLDQIAAQANNPQDYQSYTITNSHQSSTSKVWHYYLMQRVNDIDIYQALLHIHIKEDGNVLTFHDQFLSQPSERIKSKNTPPLDHGTVLIEVAKQLGISDPVLPEIKIIEDTKNRFMTYQGGNISQEEIPMKFMYVLDENNELLLCYDTNILIKNGSDWWSIKADAYTGKIVDKVNWTLECNFGNHEYHRHDVLCNTQDRRFVKKPLDDLAQNISMNQNQYNVFPLGVESPSHGNRMIVSNPANLTASPYGWHDTNGSPGAEYTFTRGNNVLAQDDLDGNNSTDGYRPEGGSNLIFDFNLDFSILPDQNLDASLTNLFYWNNLMHDVWYQYGFTESSGNFQQNNYGKGGIGNDYVLADALDGSGTNNANFSTPTDGTKPRMQMFQWSAPASSLTFTINSPSSIVGPYTAVKAAFGAQVYNITGEVVLADPILACGTLGNSSSLFGKIAVIDRGSCEFGSKCLRAQQAGAIGVIVANNVSTAPIAMSPGVDGNSVTIPCVMVSQSTGNILKNNVAAGIEVTIIGSGGIPLDSDFDNGVIAHEYGHGISIRLTGGANNSNCLNNQEQMGEGWSDWFGLMMTLQAGDNGSTGRGIGTYLLGQPTTGNGIRQFKYSTDMSINPHTYDAIKTVSVPHGVGSVWCAMLWDLTWLLNDIYGVDLDLYTGSGGNNIAMNLVIEALKLQPCSPGFVDTRNAILSADEVLYNGIHKCLIWKAFARRGLGFSASQGLSTSRTDGTQAFDMPGSCCTHVTVTNNSGVGSLRDAINCSSVGDTITFAPYLADKTISLQGGLTINKNIVVKGLVDNRIRINSTDNITPLTISNANVDMSDLIIQSAQNTQAKSILNDGNLKLTNITIENNWGNNGVPLILNNGNLELEGLVEIEP